MVERSVYVGSSLQVIVRLATGAVMQASIANTGAAAGYAQGTPVLARVPPDALRVPTADAAATSAPGAAPAASLTAPAV